jgi:hypothetical protein
LNQFLLDNGLNVLQLHKTTGVSRNVLTAMRDNEEVTLNSVAKLTKALDQAGLDSTMLRQAIKQKTIKVPMQGTAGNLLLAVDNETPLTTQRLCSLLAETLELANARLDHALKSSASDAEVDAVLKMDLERQHDFLSKSMQMLLLRLDENA